MGRDIDVLATLEAKSTQTSLDDLAKRGKKKVRVIRAADVAMMLQQSVERALESSDWIPPDQLEEVKRKAQGEFLGLKKEREQEAKLVKEQAEAIENLRRENEELGKAKAELEQRLAEREQQEQRERQERQEREEQMQADVERVPAPEAPPATGDTASALLMMRMMDEIQSLKSQAAGAPPAPQAAPPAGDTDNKLAQVIGSLDERLDKLGRKMGMSQAVDVEVDFQGLVDRAVDDGDNMESNLENLEVEKREGKGILANLERMKKLKGGG